MNLCTASMVGAALVFAAGCSIELPDGYYGCAESSRCPEDMVCWQRDHRCHTAPEPDAGPVPSDGGVDAGVDAGSDAGADAGFDAGVDAGGCGDGVVNAGEACDDGNAETETECAYGTATCAGCDATCATELSLTGGVCDDENLDVGHEECDHRGFDCTDCDVPSLVLVTRGFAGGTSESFPSAGGRFVLFTRLGRYDPRDLSNVDDVYLRDLGTGTIHLLSFAADGVSAVDGPSFAAGISEDGEVGVFVSRASNLHPDDGDGGLYGNDVFVWLRSSGEVRMIPTPMGQALHPTVSGDGRFVAFACDDPEVSGSGQRQVVLYDVMTEALEVASVSPTDARGDRGCEQPSLSRDGDLVAFVTGSRNLIVDDVNGVSDIYVRHRSGGRTTRVSVSSDGDEADGSSDEPQISPNGRWVAFLSDATNLVPGDDNGATDVFVHDRTTGETTRVSLRADGSESVGATVGMGAVSDSGLVVFATTDALLPEDDNGSLDVYARDVTTGDLRLVSVDADGSPTTGGSSLNPNVDATGSVVTFQSNAQLLTGIVDAHVYRREL